ncbi:hypothetical protein E2C01_094872 [Portunus trituberculatus]|uniref:Uncharacterized protein n=1 Tax=Portunus trituberculatus TaxID=210409 RepID=A0A5B7K2U3_PORTR|nr:hypothetical protein [Portunus trituberculatus]
MLYDNTETALPKEEIQSKLEEYWQGIYQMHPCHIEEVWNNEDRESYKTDFNLLNPSTLHMTVQGHTLTFPAHLLEHLSAIETESPPSIMNMEHPDIKDREIIQALKSITNNKAAGPDNLRGELFKLLADSKICIQTTKKCRNKTLTENQIPQS